MHAGNVFNQSINKRKTSNAKRSQHQHQQHQQLEVQGVWDCLLLCLKSQPEAAIAKAPCQCHHVQGFNM